MQYQGGYILGFSGDEPDKPAKTILALMAAPLLGKLSVPGRFLFTLLKADFLFEQFRIRIQIIHSAYGFVYMVTCDNSPVYVF